MKKIISIICCLLFCCSVCFAQDVVIQDSAKNRKIVIQHTLFAELLGSSVFFYNITYDCLFAFTKEHKIAIAAGFQYPSFFDVSYHTFGGSIQVNYLYGVKNHHLEIGTGITTLDFIKWNDIYIPIRMGYRYQRNNGGFFWKVAFTPTVSLFGFGPSGGVAIGYTFKNKKR